MPRTIGIYSFCCLLLLISCAAKPKPRQESVEQPSLSLLLPITNPACPSQRIEHMAITIDYNKQWYLPNWVAYLLTREHTTGEIGRCNGFSPDPQVKDPVYHNDYSNNPYKFDRGHMAPAADMKWDQQAMRECFYTSNICPQNQNLNRGDWNDIEELVRDYANQFDSVYVVCGPIVDSVYQTMGNYHPIAIPSAFFKALARRINGEWTVIGFICKNEAGNRPIMTYLVTIDEIERQTGHDLFGFLPDSVENRIESEIAVENWLLH